MTNGSRSIGTFGGVVVSHGAALHEVDKLLGMVRKRDKRIKIKKLLLFSSTFKAIPQFSIGQPKNSWKYLGCPGSYSYIKLNMRFFSSIVLFFSTSARARLSRTQALSRTGILAKLNHDIAHTPRDNLDLALLAHNLPVPNQTLASCPLQHL